MSDFKIKTEVFEGPLDLLLNLIEKRKLLINDLSLAQITDDFISFLKNHHEYSIKQNSQFILIASTLLLIKSKSLLPTLELTEEEENSIEDLELRLKIYKRIKDSENGIKEIFGKKMSFFGGGIAPEFKFFLPDKNTNKDGLLGAMRGILKNLPKKEVLQKVVVQKVISLDEMITKLTDRVKKNLQMSFREFSGYGKTERVNVIISFLAMLELVKNGEIDAVQKDNEDIEIQTKNFDTPSYI